ncbi:MAG: methyltransferase domain-containing protein, partial [Alphaproteobacteria bacterium]
MIDVGCGGGFMAEAMRRLGGRAIGIDISPRAIAYARNHFPSVDFTCEILEDFQNRGRMFDFVYCSEVIEHVANAERFAAALAQICRAGGYLFITTPDIGHWHVPKDLVSWPLVDPPRHVRYFNTANLRMLLERHGFTLRRKIFKRKPGLHVLAQRYI